MNTPTDKVNMETDTQSQASNMSQPGLTNTHTSQDERDYKEKNQILKGHTGTKTVYGGEE